MSESSSQELPPEVAAIFRLGFDFQQLDLPHEADAKQCQDALMALVPDWLATQHQTVRRGIELFLQHDRSDTTARVRRRVRRLLKQRDYPVDKPLLSDREWETLLRLAAEAHEDHATENAAAMYTVLQILRPEEPQPYVALFTIIWRRAGVKAAAACYRLVAPTMFSPTFFFYAADCFLNAGQTEEAREAIQISMDQWKSLESDWNLDPALIREIQAFHAELHDIRSFNPERRA